MTEPQVHKVWRPLGQSSFCSPNQKVKSIHCMWVRCRQSGRWVYRFGQDAGGGTNLPSKVPSKVPAKLKVAWERSPPPGCCWCWAWLNNSSVGAVLLWTHTTSPPTAICRHTCSQEFTWRWPHQQLYSLYSFQTICICKMHAQHYNHETNGLFNMFFEFAIFTS